MLTLSCEMVSYITYSNRGGESPSALPYSVGGKLVQGSAHAHRGDYTQVRCSGVALGFVHRRYGGFSHARVLLAPERETVSAS